jgi:hypothetical protein
MEQVACGKELRFPQLSCYSLRQVVNVGEMPELTVIDAQDLLRHCVESGQVKEGYHFRTELQAEKIGLPSAYRVLKTGIVYDPPEQDLKTGDWKYRVEGPEPNGKWIAIVFCFKEIDKVFLITIFSIKGKARPGGPKRSS